MSFNNIQYIFFDCMETIVDMHELPKKEDYAYWTYDNSGAEDCWSDKDQFLCDYMKAAEELNSKYALHEDYEMYKRIRLVTDINERIGIDNKNIIAERLYRTYWDTYRSKCFVEAGKKEVLRRLSEDYKLAVVSNFKVAGGIEELIRVNGLIEIFDFIVVSVNSGWRKPDRRIYEEAIKLSGCKSEEILFIGDDYENDYIIPRKLGMQAVLYDPGSRYPGADPISSFKELL